jgi:uncharacterized membrane protein
MSFFAAGSANRYYRALSSKRLEKKMVKGSAFEMRRLEALSNTIFGVAMTLLAYDFPRPQVTGAAPDFGAIWGSYAPRLIALVLSFIVSGIFWLSHHRRLAYAPEGSRLVVILNLLFLLTIVLLPASTALWGTYIYAGGAVVVYGTHLLVTSTLNLILWLIAVRGRPNWAPLVGAMFSTAVFVVGVICGFVAPHVAPWLWSLAFLGIPISSYVERRQGAS